MPQSALAHLAGKDILEQYEHLVYLDGDIQIVGPIAPLVAYDVAPGYILDACDHAYMNLTERGAYGNFFRAVFKGNRGNEP